MIKRINLKNDVKIILAVCAGISLIILSNINGHYYPPFSIEITPFLLPGIIGGVNYPLYKLSTKTGIFYGYALLIVNDFLIRRYAGGDHDAEGSEWILLYSLLAFIISIIIMSFYSAYGPKEETKYNLLVLFLGAIISGMILLNVNTTIR